MVEITHAKVVTKPQNPAFEVSKDEWNDKHIVDRNYLAANPADPAGGYSGTKMMGLGSVLKLTPKFSGTLKIELSAGLQHTTTNTAVAQLCYGTGAAPANGAAATGTTFGPALVRYSDGTTGYFLGSTEDATWDWVLTGLTVDTPYWFDVQLSSGGGASGASIKNIMAYFEEM